MYDLWTVLQKYEVLNYAVCPLLCGFLLRGSCQNNYFRAPEWKAWGGTSLWSVSRACQHFFNLTLDTLFPKRRVFEALPREILNEKIKIVLVCVSPNPLQTEFIYCRMSGNFQRTFFLFQPVWGTVICD